HRSRRDRVAASDTGFIKMPDPKDDPKSSGWPRKATTALAVLLVFGTASVVLADTHDRTDDHASLAHPPVPMMSNRPAGAINDAAKPFTTEKKASFAAALAQSAPFCRGITGKTIVWIKLTEPGGQPDSYQRRTRNFRQI